MVKAKRHASSRHAATRDERDPRSALTAPALAAAARQIARRLERNLSHLGLVATDCARRVVGQRPPDRRSSDAFTRHAIKVFSAAKVRRLFARTLSLGSARERL
jgi:hypothetical protein